MSGVTDSFAPIEPEASFGAERLRRTIRPQEVVAVLAAIGLTDADIAAAVGATDRSVRRWRHSGDRRASVRHRRQIDDLRTIVLILHDTGTLDDTGIIDWLRARNRDLDDARPLEALARGDFNEVRAAALAFAGD